MEPQDKPLVVSFKGTGYIPTFHTYRTKRYSPSKSMANTVPHPVLGEPERKKLKAVMFSKQMDTNTCRNVGMPDGMVGCSITRHRYGWLPLRILECGWICSFRPNCLRLAYHSLRRCSPATNSCSLWTGLISSSPEARLCW